ncbi:TadE/TadG family type IV pilus assembly protein [Sphingomonas arenae]|uniref:TadE/TadG family type IV pilus assembly protein n=1 Tax=Sphingomonas arenae TaxID=2812555 RepID=UPI0019673DF1|nr:TadE/TadG family type IV pilus assembly protein [Sphingomonas arenae]
MKSFLKKLFRNERGNALIIAALGMPLLIGFAGLANDTIQWSLWKRQLQRQADSAALAGVYARFASQNLNTAVTNDLAKNSRTGIAFATGYPIVTPLADAANWDRPVQVTLAVRQALPFSKFFMSTAPLIEATAIAGGIETGEYCVVSLENTSSTGITAGGNTNVDFGCGMITNSVSMDAAIAFGSSQVKATPIAAVGGLDSTDNWASGTTLMPFTLPQPDPFADIDPPPIPNSGCNNFSDSPNSVTTINAKQSDGTTPTCFNNLTLKGDVTFSPGVYVIKGDMNVNSSAHIKCTGCTFVLTDDPASGTGTVDINGGAELDLSAPTEGQPYQGILFYQNRGAPQTTSKINGNSQSTLQGAFYFPNSQVEYTGTAGLVFNCVQLVVRRVTFMGNSKLLNNCPANSGTPDITGHHVRLVG